MQTVGWVFTGLGFVIGLPLVFVLMHLEVYEIHLMMTPLIVFFGSGLALKIGSMFVSLFSLRSNRVKNGILVFGTIISAEQTGLIVNDQPQLEISLEFPTASGELVTASDRKVICLTDLAEIQPGGMIPLRYDPENPQKITIDFDADLEDLQAALDTQMIATGETTQEKIDIRNNGVKAEGVVLSAVPTGKIINSEGEMSLHINVERPNNDGTFEVVTERPVSPQHLSDVQPGCVIDVYYLPWDEQNIVIAYKFV